MFTKFTRYFSKKNHHNNQKAWQDFCEGIRSWRIWWLFAMQDIRLRYRRSKLGPLWLTLSMAVTVYSMGFLYGHLFHTDLESYYPYLAASMIGWSLISSVITDMSEIFLQSEGIIKQIKLPYSLYIHRTVMRNFIIFLHNLIVYIPIILIFHQIAKVNLFTLSLLSNLLIIYINAFFYGLIIAIFCARFPDMMQIVRNIIQVIFFITPIMWMPTVLPEQYQWFVYLNPFYAFLQLIRAPLMGHGLALLEWINIGIITLFGIVFAGKLFAKYRARIVYWV